MHLIILTFLFGAKLNYESCMAKPKLTQNGEIWTTTVKKCLLGRFCEVMIWKRFYFINLRFLHFLVYATKSKRLPQPLETQNKSIILLFFAFLGVILFQNLRRLFLTTKIRRIVESTKLSAIFLHKVSSFCISIHYL